ncbi:prohibitin family protein [Pseudopelagicola sp. nBUS_19]|uniref:prohibitin family protein n=1 Tax=Pseudopelagicola sp. nBUS_19 TaxID=3395316 RepID=UPI003EB6B3E4
MQAEKQTNDAAVVLSPSEKYPPTARRFIQVNRRKILLAIMGCVLLLTALAPRLLVIVPAGHGGVLFKSFWEGTDLTRTLGEGLNIIAPWNLVTNYSLRLSVAEESYPVVSSKGLHYNIHASFRWRLNTTTLPILHRDLGASYTEVMLVPEVGSVLRDIVSKYTAEEVYASGRESIQLEVYNELVGDSRTENIGPYIQRVRASTHHLIFLESILIRDVVLPEYLTAAIERKLEQAQVAEEYEFRVAREKLEAQRKEIEAQGIQKFTQTVQAGITDQYLKWRGVEATLELAQSKNAKVVVIGGGSDGLPLILNTGNFANVSDDITTATGSSETVNPYATPSLNAPVIDATR